MSQPMSSHPIPDHDGAITVAHQSVGTPHTGEAGHEVPHQPSGPKIGKSLQGLFSNRPPLRRRTDSALQSSSSIQAPAPPIASEPVGPQSQSSRLDHPVRGRAQKWNHKKLLEEYVKLHGRKVDAEKTIIDLEKDLDFTELENAKLQEQLSRQDQDVRRAQESAFALMASNVSRAEDDETVRSKLRAVRGQWKIFAKDWALSSLNDVGDRDKAAVQHLINRLIAPDEAQARDGLMTLANRGKAAAILLNAELARVIGQQLIVRPFISAFGLGTSFDDSAKASLFTMNDLERIYNLSVNGSPAAAHDWRSRTVELLDQLGPNSSIANEEARNRRERYYRKLVEDFESSNPAALLYRPCSLKEERARKDQLLEVFRYTGETVCRLWHQKVYITALGPERLLRQRFEITSEEAEAHATHRLEAGDTSMDGLPIQLVVEPGIVAWGNERGEAYEKRKIWLKAVVWLSSGAFGEAKRGGQ